MSASTYVFLQQHSNSRNRFGNVPLTAYKLNERVIVDNDGIANYGRDKNLRAVEDMIGVMMERVGGWLAKEQNIKGGGYDDLHGELDHFVPEKPFSKLQAQLCPSTINCFTLTANTWYQVSVKHLKEVDWSMEAFTHLVMNKDQKQMLRNLVEQHRSNKGKMVTDVIRGKGKVGSHLSRALAPADRCRGL